MAFETGDMGVITGLSAFILDLVIGMVIIRDSQVLWCVSASRISGRRIRLMLFG